MMMLVCCASAALHIKKAHIRVIAARDDRAVGFVRQEVRREDVTHVTSVGE